jgi:type IV fimbrial biogenesis protein FimT
VRLSFHTHALGSCYVLHTGAVAQCMCGAAAPAQCSGDALQIKTVVLPVGEKVSLQANVVSILFDPLHGTSTPSATLRLVGTQGRAVHHVVNVMGRVRSCSPSQSMPGYRPC